MFNGVKKWLNGPIDDNGLFGTRIRKCYQTLVKRETPQPTDVKNEETKPVVVNIQKIESKPKPFDDSSFLTTILMEIQSRQLFLHANYDLFSNSKICLLEYDNLIEQLKSCISISELSPSEIQERINTYTQVKNIETHCDTLKPIPHNPSNELKVDASPVENTKEELGPIPEAPTIQIPIDQVRVQRSLDWDKIAKEILVVTPIVPPVAQAPVDARFEAALESMYNEDDKIASDETVLKDQPLIQAPINPGFGMVKQAEAIPEKISNKEMVKHAEVMLEKISNKENETTHAAEQKAEINNLNQRIEQDKIQQQLINNLNQRTQQLASRPDNQPVITDSTGTKYISEKELKNLPFVKPEEVVAEKFTTTARTLINIPHNDNTDEIVVDNTEEYSNTSGSARELRFMPNDDKAEEIVDDDAVVAPINT